MSEDDAPKTFVYKFSNVGKETIAIDRLVSSCSCASAVSVKTELAPGESSEIRVTYSPKGHPGRFERKVFMYTQPGTNPAAVLKLTVDVSNGSDYATQWPIQMGGIRLRSKEVTFIEGKKAVETLAKIYAERVVDPENQRVGITHGDCLEEAQALAEKICAVGKPAELILCPHEPFTGSHVGPGMLAVFFFGKGR